MSWNIHSENESKSNDGWGGAWTEKKLTAFSKYVWSYLTIMKKYPIWKTIYFDGFAGSGSNEREPKSELFKQLKITDEEERTYQGSAERVLTIKDNHTFDYYYFVDKKEASIKNLETVLNSKLDLKGKKIAYRYGDANKWIIELAKALKSNKFAALIFLDPFGMQIDWDSIKELKDSRSDVWILVPTGVIVNRLLEKSGELKHIKKLESFFGMKEEEIKKIFYKQEIKSTLFGEEEIIEKIGKPIERIAEIYASQMKTIWNYVTEKPLRLNNSTGSPIFHFIFASNNNSAYKIAKDIIKNI